MPAEPVEYKPKTTHYFSDPIEAVFTYEKYKDACIGIILSSPAKASFKDHAHLIDFIDDIFKWNEAKLRTLDQTTLYGVTTLAKKRTENND